MVRESGQVGDEKCEKIEVTPEMVAVGIAELSRFNPDYEDEPSAVERIFLAMLSVCKCRSRSEPS